MAEIKLNNQALAFKQDDTPTPCLGCGVELKPLEMPGAGYLVRKMCDACAEAYKVKVNEDIRRASAKEREETFQRAGVPLHEVESYLEQDGELCEPIKRVLAGEARGALLYGRETTGKTGHLKLALYHGLEHHGLSIELVTEESFCQSLKFENKIPMEHYHGINLLAIDDLGQSELTDFDRRNIKDLLEHRLAYRLPTLFASRMNVDELIAFYPREISAKLLKILGHRTQVEEMKKDFFGTQLMEFFN